MCNIRSYSTQFISFILCLCSFGAIGIQVVEFLSFYNTENVSTKSIFFASLCTGCSQVKRTIHVIILKQPCSTEYFSLRNQILHYILHYSTSKAAKILWHILTGSAPIIPYIYWKLFKQLKYKSQILCGFWSACIIQKVTGTAWNIWNVNNFLHILQIENSTEPPKSILYDPQKHVFAMQFTCQF